MCHIIFKKYYNKTPQALLRLNKNKIKINQKNKKKEKTESNKKNERRGEKMNKKKRRKKGFGPVDGFLREHVSTEFAGNGHTLPY